MSNFFNEFFAGSEEDHYYVSAKVCLSIAKSIEVLMAEKNISKSALAELLGTSRPYISKLLRGDANFTIETLSKVAIALDAEIKTALISKSKYKALDNQLRAFMRFDASEKAREKMHKSWVETVSSCNDEAYTGLKIQGGATNAVACSA